MHYAALPEISPSVSRNGEPGSLRIIKRSKEALQTLRYRVVLLTRGFLVFTSLRKE